MQMHSFEGRDQDNVLGVATWYRLDRPLFEPRGARFFFSPHPFRPALAPTQPPGQRASGIPLAGKAAEA
jgi:hypothetical protein